MKKHGFTLIELLMAILVSSVAFFSLLVVFVNTSARSVNQEALSIGINLANGKLEQLSSQSYSSVSDEATTPFSGDFAGFSSLVEVSFVSSEALDTAVGTDWGYKKVVVKVMSNTLPVTIEASGLITDAANE